MGNSLFDRRKEEKKDLKRSILDSTKKTFINGLFIGLAGFGTFIGINFSGGLVLLIDGGIIITYVITQIIVAIYDKIIEIYESRIEEIISEITILKENMNYKITNTIMDNAPPLSNSLLTSFSTNNENKFENIKNLETVKYITSISFFRSNSIDLSMKELQYYNFEPVEGDIRKGAGDLYCILGCKYENNKPFITNIIGSVSDKEEPVIIYENEIKYIVIKDPLNNADIHKESGGNFLFLYYTTDPKAGKPIKYLKTLSTNQFLNEPNLVKYSMRNTKYNKPFQSLDCNRGRDFFLRRTPQNYIIIERD